MLTGEHVTVRYGGFTAVDDLSFRLEEGQWLVLAGPNGAGKSTLAGAIAGQIPFGGSIRWQGRDVRKIKPSAFAREVGFLTQSHSMTYAYTVDEVVRLGRYAHRSGFFSRTDMEEEERVEQALALTGLTELRYASMLTLSGGEMQRAFLAQVFAQDPKVLILDEPANHLDLKYQQHIFSLIRQWLREPGRAVMSVVHDLSLAKRYGTHALLMDHGRCVSQGTISSVLTPEHLRQVYDRDVYAWMREMLSQWE